MKEITNNALIEMSYEIQQYPLVSTIAFISDLHFDFVNEKYYEEQGEWNKNTFIAHVKENYKQSILCIAGDCFSKWDKTLAFIKEMEKRADKRLHCPRES